MSAKSLAAALAATGLPGRVEALGGMAIFTPNEATVLTVLSQDAELRGRATALALVHGFPVLGLELPPDRDIGEIFPGD